MTESPKKAAASCDSSPRRRSDCGEISLCLLRFELSEKAAPLQVDFQASWMPNKKKGKPILSSADPAKLRGQRNPSELSIETFEATPPREAEKVDTERLSFFSGNPFVEKTEGILHIFKKNELTSLKEESVGRSEMLCMLGVPATLTSHDLLSFVGPASESIAKLRIIRDHSPNHYMVLLQFRSQPAADAFFRDYDGTTFNGIEEHICHLAYVGAVESLEGGDAAPPEGHTELPTCPVCLERMEESVDGVLTILCNHSFHAACLSQWGDTSCPVCRHCQTPAAETNKCMVCSRDNDLWICLICGHVGCGRYEQAHAFKHFEETSHTFSLQMGTQRVWDYAGDNYVHRLIQTKEDGKVVEFEPASRDAAQVEGEEKIEGITLEYTCLLTSQLESQRRYFEAKMDALDRKSAEQLEAMEAAGVRAACNELEAEAKRRAQTERKLTAVNAKLEKATAELEEERLMNRVLRTEQSQWADKVKELEQRLVATTQDKDKEIAALQEEMRDLMFHLEGREKLANEGAVPTEEIHEASLSVGEAAAGGKKGRRRRK